MMALRNIAIVLGVVATAGFVDIGTQTFNDGRYLVTAVAALGIAGSLAVILMNWRRLE